MGHSQGGSIIPLVAQERTDIRLVIAFASPATPIDSLLPDQYRYIYDKCLDPAEGEVIAQQLESVFEQIRAGTFPSGTPFLGAYPFFWEEWIKMSDETISTYASITQPTLFMQGTGRL